MRYPSRALCAVASIITASLVTIPGSRAATDCVDADAGAELAGIKGDFEITPDYQDPEQRLLYVSNTARGSANVVMARLNGTNGKVVTGMLTTIAKNFTGSNGPEFIQKPSGEAR